MPPAASRRRKSSGGGGGGGGGGGRQGHRTSHSEGVWIIEKDISAPICISLTSCASPSPSSSSKSSKAFKQAFLNASPTASRQRDSKEGGCLRQGMACKQGCGSSFNSLHCLKGKTRCVLPPSHGRTALARSVLIVLKLESKSPPDEGRFFGNIARLSLRQEWGSLHCAGLSYCSSEST